MHSFIAKRHYNEVICKNSLNLRFTSPTELCQDFGVILMNFLEGPGIIERT